MRQIRYIRVLLDDPNAQEPTADGLYGILFCVRRPVHMMQIFPWKIHCVRIADETRKTMCSSDNPTATLIEQPEIELVYVIAPDEESFVELVDELMRVDIELVEEVLVS